MCHHVGHGHVGTSHACVPVAAAVSPQRLPRWKRLCLMDRKNKAYFCLSVTRGCCAASLDHRLSAQPVVEALNTCGSHRGIRRVDSACLPLYDPVAAT